MIRLGSVNVSHWQRYLRDRAAALSGPVRLVIKCNPNRRDDGGDNDNVLARLMEPSRSALAQGGPDVARAVDLGRRSRPWQAAQLTLRDLAFAAGPFLARAIAARLRSGRYVFNNEETRRRKGGKPPGVDTEQLAASLDNALVRVE